MDSDSAFLASPQQPAIRAWTLHSPSPGHPVRSGVLHWGGKGGGEGPGSRAGAHHLQKHTRTSAGTAEAATSTPTRAPGKSSGRPGGGQRERVRRARARGSGWSALRARVPHTLNPVMGGLRMGVAGEAGLQPRKAGLLEAVEGRRGSMHPPSGPVPMPPPTPAVPTRLFHALLLRDHPP